MLKNKYLKVIFYCFFFAISCVANAQESSSTLPLTTYLQQLEEQFNIRISFANKDTDTLTITPSTDNNLESILNYIAKKTSLTLTKLSQRYYAFSKENTISIHAKFLDNFEQNTINGATVEVLEQNIATVTDSTGYFTLNNIPKDAIIKVRFIGYKTMHFNATELNKNKPVNTFLLKQHYVQLKEVVISKFLTTGLRKSKDGSVILNTSDFGILPGLIEPDVLQTVQALPGIKSSNETVSDINVRGGTNDQNLVLWEDIKMYQSGHFFGLISAFNPYLTNSVTITKNGTSPQYGDGISSVIDMRTNNNVNDSFFGAGFNMISADAYTQVPITNKGALQFSARRSITDFLNSPTYNRYFDKTFQDSDIENNDRDTEITRREDFYFYDFTAKALYDITNKHKLRFSFIYMNNVLNYEETNANNESNFSNLDQKNTSFGGSLESKWTNKFSTKINAYRTSYNLNANEVANNQEQQLQQTNKVLENGLKVNTKYQLTDNIKLINGYQLIETGIINFTNVTQPPYKKNIKGVIRAHSIFSEIDYQTIKLKARAGARVNYIENINTFKRWIVEPRLNINYNVATNFNASLLGEFKSQTTNQIIDLEQNFLGVEKRRWILADEDELPVTTSKQLSVGFNYEKNSIYIGIEGFYKNVKGISTLTQGFQNQDQFNGEIGKYNIKGIEFLINKKNNNYSTWLSYTYNLNNYVFKDITPNTFPNNLDIRHTITFAANYNYKKFKIGVGVNYNSGKPYTEPEEGNNALDLFSFPAKINYKDPNSSRLPNYVRADISALYNFKISKKYKATLGTSILNILNKENILNRYYRVTNDNEIETVESVSLGITPNASFRINF
ncbi:carboxypeptidase-like regulatory domain-containing protein [Cellulophaga lytica]|uniref:TonB-dependent receptor n=1 Tax=Cellulophaga lytica TaxID=979 RepID=UPI0026E225FC|nr:carboxypeptidase-like regulatory domain-containing protein [Cellulophaga lytica]MDO6853486.1 carboxypeptidase-like regulatory domain-containing protein [Cellulophaga lytica]